MPLWLPQPLALIYISGICEIVLAFILPLRTRRLAAWCIIILLIAIFPANIQMTLSYYRDHNPYLWLPILRLPLQFVLIWWAWKFSKTN